MNYRFDYVRTDGVDKIIDMVKHEIRQFQENQFYKAVESITDSQRITLVQTLKQFQKEHLGPIKVESTVFEKGVLRVEYKFMVGHNDAVKMTLHGSESGVAYFTPYSGYEMIVNQIEQRFKNK